MSTLYFVFIPKKENHILVTQVKRNLIDDNPPRKSILSDRGPTVSEFESYVCMSQYDLKSSVNIQDLKLWSSFCRVSEANISSTAAFMWQQLQTEPLQHWLKDTWLDVWWTKLQPEKWSVIYLRVKTSATTQWQFERDYSGNYFIFSCAYS